MGLPGAGKTTLSRKLAAYLEGLGNTVHCINADEVRTLFDDWDFSYDGRLRQTKRVYHLSECSCAEYVIADFVCPIQEMRNIFKADWLVWVDTIAEGRYDDTNKIFEPPAVYNTRVTDQDAEKWALIIAKDIFQHKELINETTILQRH